jgi:hypothetical protein
MLGIGGYLMRRFRPSRTEPRLAVIDAASVDGRRRLVLIHRDNVEHLLLIGGPTDVVIELNIDRTVAAATAAAQVREPRASPRLTPPPCQTLSLEYLGSPPSEPVHGEPPLAPSGPGHNAARGNGAGGGDPREAMIRETMRAGQNEESNLSEMALRLQTALRRPIKPVEPV